MKFNYQATILIGTVALASIFNAGQANASDCKIIAVPWEWKLTKSGGPSFTESVDASNTGDSFTTISRRRPLGGTFNVKLDFNPPDQFCDKLGSEPTEIILKIIGTFTGTLQTSFSQEQRGNPPDPRLPPAFATARASVDILQPFDFKQLFSRTDPQEPFVQTKERIDSFTDGETISFTGELEGAATKGQDPLGSILFSRSQAQLNLTGVFDGATSGTVYYAVSVPEPLTILGSATGVGFAAFFKRKHSKKQKKS